MQIIIKRFFSFLKNNISWLFPVILMVACYFLYKRVLALSNQLSSYEKNLVELTKSNSQLTFQGSQLKDFLKKAESRDVYLIDSISKANHIKLGSIQETQIDHYHFIDSTHIKAITPVYKEITTLTDSTISRRFEVTSDCFTVNGNIITKDPESEVSLNKVELNDTIVHITYKKRAKWYQFWKWFSKPEIESIAVGSCGNVNFKNFKKN